MQANFLRYKMKWSTLAEKTHQELKRQAIFDPHEHLLLGFSGGLDSMVLLHVLLELQPYWQWKLTIGHIDHGLRPEYDEKESVFCKHYAEKLQLPYLEEKLQLHAPEVKKHYLSTSTQSPGLESLARAERYRIFATWAEDVKADAVLTAHHANDQAETILYRMLTGSGIRGLTGIPEERGIFRRPFLHILRQDLENYAHEKKLPFCEDLSNRNENIIRNKIRHRLIPFLKKSGFKQTENNLARSAESLEEVNEALAFFENICIDKVVYKTEKGVHLQRAEFKELPRYMQSSILRYVFENEKKVKRHISRQQLSRVIDFIIRSDTGRSMELLGHNIVNERKYITLFHCAPMKFYYAFNCEKNKGAGNEDAGFLYIDIVPNTAALDDRQQKQAFFSPEIIGKKLVLRSWEPGDRMKLFGSSATKKVSDILKDKKVRASEKNTYPVLLADNEIIWIPGVKRSNKFPVEKKDKKIVHIFYKKLENINDQKNLNA